MYVSVKVSMVGRVMVNVCFRFKHEFGHYVPIYCHYSVSGHLVQHHYSHISTMNT